MWNLATDPDGGPRDEASSQGCADCRGLLVVDGDQVEPGPEFFVLAHLERAAESGSHVLGTRASAEVEAVAFADPDGTIGVFAHNRSDSEQVLAIRVPGRDDARYAVRAGELLTVRLPSLSRTTS
jgi:glucosylceramidase